MKRATLEHAGFSLLELMIAIAMIGILSGLAISSLTDLAPNYRLKTAARELYSDMQNAKIEAIKTNTNATIQFTPQPYNPAGQVGSYQISIGATILPQKSMPQNVSLISISPTSAGNTAGFTSRGISLQAIPREVEFRNNQSRWYRITLSPAGALKINTSSDGVNWN